MAAGLALAGCSRQIKKASRPSTKTSQSSKKKASQPDKITQIMNKMTLDEKIGQLYFAHSTGNFDQMKADISKYHLGGTTLFGPDFKDRSKTQFKQEMQTYQSNSSYGLLIATDQEGGTVSRINTNSKISTRKYPSPQEIYQARGLKGIKQEDSNVARDRQSFIYDRTLGQNYEITAKYIPIAVDAIQSQGVASCLKHFPGYGDAADTHTGFAQINKPLTKYEQEDLLPFKAGIEAGVDSIMVSHIVIKGLDPKLPASLSPVVHKLLRKKLNYQGLILTDDLQMGAITQYAKKHNTNADVLALKAGNDMLLGGTYQTGIPAIKKAIQTGQISTSQIDHSVRRILLLKEKLGILK